jgi:peptidoglycan hydrolase-like protein with peptidoglycan-binding domain
MEVLRQGVRRDQVKLLQRLLNKKGAIAPPLREDGIFGAKTRECVCSFSGTGKACR